MVTRVFSRIIKLRLIFLTALAFLCFLGGYAQNRMVVGAISCQGNRKTGDGIILREMMLHAGDTVSKMQIGELIQQSRLNLLNTTLFNFVSIDTVVTERQSETPELSLRVQLIERWYVWPLPTFQLSDRNFNAWWKERDFSRVTYGADVKWNNVSGRMDLIQLSFKGGTSQNFSLSYTNPYIDRQKRFGIGFNMGFTNLIETSYITSGDQLRFIASNIGISNEQWAAFTATYRRNIYVVHQFSLGVNNRHFSDTLLRANPAYSYAGLSDPSFIHMHYKVKIDHRDIRYYPLHGWYADLELHKDGLGMGWEGPVNSFLTKTTLRYFSQPFDKIYTGAALVVKASWPASQPYFLQNGIGFMNDFVRGYEYNVIDGQYFVIGRSTVKYALMPQRNFNIPFIPSTKFSKTFLAIFLTAFADAGYSRMNQNSEILTNKLPNSLLAGTGAGLDFVTYYDKVMRIEYSINRSGKSGIFIQFISGI